MNAPADGHAMMFTSSSIPVLDPLLKKAMQFDPTGVTTSFLEGCGMNESASRAAAKSLIQGQLAVRTVDVREQKE